MNWSAKRTRNSISKTGRTITDIQRVLRISDTTDTNIISRRSNKYPGTSGTGGNINRTTPGLGSDIESTTGRSANHLKTATGYYIYIRKRLTKSLRSKRKSENRKNDRQQLLHWFNYNKKYLSKYSIHILTGQHPKR